MKPKQTTSRPKAVLTIDTSIPAKETNSITFHCGDDAMLRIAPDGFYVRGVKIAQDELEANRVYESFMQWLAWTQLNKQ